MVKKIRTYEQKVKDEGEKQTAVTKLPTAVETAELTEVGQVIKAAEAETNPAVKKGRPKAGDAIDFVYQFNGAEQMTFSTTEIQKIFQELEKIPALYSRQLLNFLEAKIEEFRTEIQNNIKKGK